MAPRAPSAPPPPTVPEVSAPGPWTRGGVPARVLVVVCGGLGGVIGGTLADPACPGPPELAAPVVHLVSTNDRITEAVRRQGLVIHEASEPPRRVTVPIDRALAPRAVAPFDVVVLATPPDRSEEAARDALPHAHAGTRFVVCANGLVEPRIAKRVGPGRVVGAVVVWGASQRGPGVVERTSDGATTLGLLHRAPTPALHALQRLMAPLGSVHTTDDLLGARWSKLAVNSAISTLGTLGGDRLGVLMRHRHVRRLALEIMSEAAAVARAEGVALRPLAGAVDLDRLALTRWERPDHPLGWPTLTAKHALLLAVGLRYRRLRSSMLRALERGRVPPVEHLNGEVVAAGARHGVATPVNAAATEALLDLARSGRPPGVAVLDALYEATRP